MDTSSAAFYLLINFLFAVCSAKPDPGLRELSALLQGPRYDTTVELEKVTFLHFTRNSSEYATEYNDVTNDYDKLDSNVPLVIILHGFMGSAHSKSTKLMIEGYVNRGGYNVIGVHWEDLAKGPWYGRAAERSYLAAKQLAEWMTALVTANVTTWKNIHIVGFSLGAQVAGITSKYLPNGARVGRLTGLDPARPMFDDKLDEDHLDAEDSDFTTVVHTCGGFLAVPDPLGHVDFYPNGGENPQPPCTEDNLSGLLHKYIDSPSLIVAPSERAATKIFASLVCSHYVALALWVETLHPETKLIGTSCQSWKNYVNNKCDNGNSSSIEVEMGEGTPHSARGKYYLKTETQVTYASILNSLIADGIEEYSKILSMNLSDKDRGHGEIEEVTPEIKVMINVSTTVRPHHNDPELHDNDINRLDRQKSPSSTSNNCINLYVFIPLLIISLKRLS